MDLGGNHGITEILDKYGSIAIAAAPITASLVARLMFGKSRIMTATVRLSAGWLAARVFLTPHVEQMQQTLIALTSLIHGNGYN